MNAKRLLKEYILPLAVEAVVVLLFLRFVAFLSVVPTGSMLPTVEEGGWMIVTRMYFPEKTVQRGDIVLFESEELGNTLVKRVIGLPGDTVELDDAGKLYINGEYYPEPYVVYPQAQSGYWEVPEGCYFFMGDNRAGSWDARYWDNPFIPADKLIGEARFTLWPLSHFGFLH